ncbi:phosphate ABC transporter permease subunit PstC [Kribbella sandramycini]|uniref:Phosphate transport system permease protein n=1 Tax=Kribbella sandramycini TaxID=60450 RepID=A0A7Y4L3U3_9ACTN|nr:phosphate ABC transporter permease subunit PstC [Kribbella sandramycini]MBB6566398.1 phosphate transport system permease protein [Kribbella sandramycini]NOL42942.1 phosphate ABC transporter permease subunit PstC [Kribbella sandramycini]
MSSPDGTEPPGRPAGPEPKIEDLVDETGPALRFDALAEETDDDGRRTGGTAVATKDDSKKELALGPVGHLGDRLFSGLAHGSGAVVILIVAFVGVFLLALAIPALADNNSNFLFSRVWEPGGAEPRFGIAALFYTTLISSVIAMVIAVPIAIGVALFVTYYAPRRIATPVAHAVDLLAAVPSIVYGLWGALFFAPILLPVINGLSSALGWIPVFDKAPGDNVGVIFTVSVVLAIMILPVVTAISREIFAQTPISHREGALALGATRWEMVRMAVLPYGRSGVVSASMLGLGRALGETVAVMIILTVPNGNDPWDPSIFAGGETFASKIANNAAEFDSPEKTGAFIAAGLVLFVVTFLVNSAARLIVARSAPGAKRPRRNRRAGATEGASA